MIWSAVAGIARTIVGGVKDHFEDKRELKAARTRAKLRRLESAQRHDQRWEIMQLENNGWQDDILFYFFIGLFILAGVYPEAAQEFFRNLKILPDWFVQTWMWIVASVIGVKKIGDYGPRMVEGFKTASAAGQAVLQEFNKEQSQEGEEGEGVISQVKETASDVADAVTGEEDNQETPGEPGRGGR